MMIVRFISIGVFVFAIFLSLSIELPVTPKTTLLPNSTTQTTFVNSTAQSNITVQLPETPLLRCGQVYRKTRPRFHLVRRCARSDMRIVIAVNVTSAWRCSDYAMFKRGLAFNFGWQKGGVGHCEVLECPEHDTLSFLHMRDNFDYYSLYANPMPSADWRCVPKLGIFRVGHGEARSQAGHSCLQWALMRSPPVNKTDGEQGLGSLNPGNAEESHGQTPESSSPTTTPSPTKQKFESQIPSSADFLNFESSRPISDDALSFPPFLIPHFDEGQPPDALISQWVEEYRKSESLTSNATDPNIQKEGGELANVLSEERTFNLTTFLSTVMGKYFSPVLVGLASTPSNLNLFTTPAGEPLPCFRFRGWAPGHPLTPKRFAALIERSLAPKPSVNATRNGTSEGNANSTSSTNSTTGMNSTQVNQTDSTNSTQVTKTDSTNSTQVTKTDSTNSTQPSISNATNSVSNTTSVKASLVQNGTSIPETSVNSTALNGTTLNGTSWINPNYTRLLAEKKRDEMTLCVYLRPDGLWHTRICATKALFLCEFLPSGGPCRNAKNSDERKECEEEKIGTTQDRCSAWQDEMVTTTMMSIVPDKDNGGGNTGNTDNNDNDHDDSDNDDYDNNDGGNNGGNDDDKNNGGNNGDNNDNDDYDNTGDNNDGGINNENSNNGGGNSNGNDNAGVDNDNDDNDYNDDEGGNSANNDQNGDVNANNNDKNPGDNGYDDYNNDKFLG